MFRVASRQGLHDDCLSGVAGNLDKRGMCAPFLLSVRIVLVMAACRFFARVVGLLHMHDVFACL